MRMTHKIVFGMKSDGEEREKGVWGRKREIIGKIPSHFPAIACEQLRIEIELNVVHSLSLTSTLFILGSKKEEEEAGGMT